MLRRAAWSALFVLLGCGRIGYGDLDASVPPLDPDGSTDTSPPDTSIEADSSVVLDGMTGTVGVTVELALERQATAVALPERLPAAVTSPAATADGNLVYVAGGSQDAFSASNCTRDVVVYDPVAGMMSMTDELPVSVQGLGLLQVGDTLHSVMGFCGGSGTDERSVYRHPMGGATPELVGLFDTGAYYTTAGVISDGSGTPKLIVAGGFGSGPLRDFVQIMDPTDGTATTLASTLPSHRCLASGVSVEARFYLFGGSLNTNCVPPTSSTDPDLTSEILRITLAPTESVEVVGNLPVPVAASCSVMLSTGQIAIFGGVEYVSDMAGGFTRQVTNRIQIFTPASGEAIVSAATLPSPRAQMGCARTADDRVLLFGGVDETGAATDEVLLFAPYAYSGEGGSVLNSGQPGADWTSLVVEATVPDGTAITVAVRAMDDPSSPGAWVEVTPGVLPPEVPDGQYLEWRATLTTSRPSVTPAVSNVRATFDF